MVDNNENTPTDFTTMMEPNNNSNNNTPAAPISTTVVTHATYRFVICAALNSCNLGYDIGVSTEAAFLIQDSWRLSDVQTEIFIGCLNFFAST